jgi:hypothetical protein
MTALTKDDLVDALRQVARSAPAAAPVNLGPGGGKDFLKNLSEGANIAGGALRGVIEGGVKFGDTVGGVGQLIGRIGDKSKIAGDALSYMGQYAQQSVDAMRNFGKFGAGFNGDAIAMRSSIAQTNMSLEEYGKFLNKNTSILNAMGGSVTQGVARFNEFSQAFFDQQAKQGDSFGSVSDQLRNLGMTSEEINGTLAIELASRRFQNMEDTKSREDAIASAASMATEMDKIAKLTGKSRETQQAEMALLEKDGQYQANLRMLQRQGNTFAVEGMTKAMTSMQQFGPGVQNLMKDFLAFGTATKETQDTLAGLGPAGTELQNAIQMVKSAKTEEQKIAAEAAVKRAEEAIKSQILSDDFTAAAGMNTKGFRQLADQTTTIAAGMDKVATANNLNLSLEADRRKANQILNAQAKQQQDDARTLAKPGEADAGKATTQAVVQFEKVMQNATAAVQDQFVNRLNGEIATGMIEFTKFLKAPGFSRERMAGGVEKGYTGIKEAFNNPGSLIPGKDPNNPDANRRPGRPEERSEGTYGAGKMFENVGSILEITKPGEVVLNGEQQMNLAKGMMDKGAATAFNNLSKNLDLSKLSAGMPKFEMPKFEMPKFEMPKFDASALKGTITENGKTREMSQADLSKATNDISKMMGNLDLTQLSKKFTTEISSVTGGGASTVKGPDIKELSKPFEKSFADMPATGSQLTQSASVEKLAQEQALASKKQQAEASVESAKIYKDSSEKFVSFLEKDIAAKEQELAATDSERTKRRLENELTTQRTKLDGAKSQVIEDTKNLLTAEKELADAQQQSVAAEASIREETIQQTNNIAEQTQSMLATKKEFSDSELQQIGHELSTLADEKQVQSIRQASVQTSLDKLQAQKDIYENNQRYEEKDLAESNEELAMLRNRIDNSESAAEIQELQAQIADEESINLSLQNRIAERNQNILNATADIAIKEQELQDLKEEMADTEIAIQDKQSELLDHVSNQGEIVTESDEDLALYGANQPEITEESPEDLALYGANQTPRDTEFGDLAGAIAKNKTQTTTGRDPFASMLDRFMGPMAGPASATAGVDAAKNSAVKDAEKKDAEAKQQAQTAKTATATATDAKPKTTAGAGKETTLSDVVASLDTLNMQVGKLSGEMSKLPNLMEKAVSATKSLNGNLNMRA